MRERRQVILNSLSGGELAGAFAVMAGGWLVGAMSGAIAEEISPKKRRGKSEDWAAAGANTAFFLLELARERSR